eukprot:7698722-Alexandrium_andersonii.AAC.1
MRARERARVRVLGPPGRAAPQLPVARLVGSSGAPRPLPGLPRGPCPPAGPAAPWPPAHLPD